MLIGSQGVRPVLISGTLLALAAVICVTSLLFRTRLRYQIAYREAAIIQNIVLFQSSLEPDVEVFKDETNAVGQLVLLHWADQLERALQKMRGVIGARVYDAGGNILVTIPLFLKEKELESSWLEVALEGNFTNEFLPSVDITSLFDLGRATTTPAASSVPVHRILVPLKAPNSETVLGVVDLLLDAQQLASEYRKLDQILVKQAALLYIAVGAPLLVLLSRLAAKLEKNHRELQTHVEKLARANMELSLRAATSAVGAVAAQLLHDIRNPLTGLLFILQQLHRRGSSSDQDVEEALHQTRRIQLLVEQIGRVLREAATATQYELHLSDMLEILKDRLLPLADERQVSLQFEVQDKTLSETKLDNRQANLALLILDQLLRNGIEASPKGSSVKLRLERCVGELRFVVSDQGPGLPEQVLKNLFKPSKSSKPQGAGLGLAIANQLAHHLGGSLALVYTGSQGTAFALQFPLLANKA